jgi:hypothetical protein
MGIISGGEGGGKFRDAVVTLASADVSLLIFVIQRETDRIMGANHLYFIAVLFVEGLKAGRVRPQNPIDKPVGRGVDGLIRMTVVEERVGGIGTMQQPALIRLNGHHAVAPAVTMKGDEPNIRLYPGQNGNAHEVKPGQVSLVVDDPKRIVCPMCGNVELILEPFGMQGCLVFPGVDMDLCLRKIAEAAGMIDVQVGHDDVGDIIG